ncbi:polyamine aminopropyltransferase [Artemisia annua]|uniref:Polyamine aminopropyltransferase n=1 Tax=Artemisia annua TaxID=35608 RepID=A0A2U1QKM5_ARTAN|nr:polyamine aminopropyltransferase [Artemisia annua]
MCSMHTGATQFQDIQLLDTKPFGKVLVIDGKLQSAEIDEFMCDIDEEVVEFCKSYLSVKTKAFCDPRLELIINDARYGYSDVMIARSETGWPHDGDLTQHGVNRENAQVYNRKVIRKMTAITPKGTPARPAHISSYADIWGWVMASDYPITLSPDELGLRMKQRINGENRYLDGKTFVSASTLSKAVWKSLEEETHVYTEGSASFIYGHGHGSDHKHNHN